MNASKENACRALSILRENTESTGHEKVATFWPSDYEFLETFLLAAQRKLPSEDSYGKQRGKAGRGKASKQQEPNLEPVVRLQFRDGDTGRTIRISDFLTVDQINQAAVCSSAREIAEKVITPNMAEINRKLGQENDALFLAYAVEHVFNVVGVRK